MKYIKIILSIITILMSVLGLMGVIAFNISLPIALMSLAIINVLNGIAFYKVGDKKNSTLLLVSGVFLFAVVAYNVIF